MNNVYAIVKNESVINVIMWEGEPDWAPDKGEAIRAPDGVGIGWGYANGQFTAPPEPELTPDELAAKNLLTAQAAYENASNKITALNEQIQDDDFDGTTEVTVKAELAAWTNYRKDLRAYIKNADGNQPLPTAPPEVLN
ncbi:hypothetical protein [Citrobacter sp. C1]|uniref:hypothetical protein n=1 Tax=Citrobacter sp. C1 TaxID=2769343 RepID=UPI001660F981|nr:hypothetical protein [Citrobacter sp. C1]MBD0830055.1 hypothetical protein [Citrobacter sp. C1]